MSKRRKAFLARSLPLKKFTRNVIVRDFDITTEEFDDLIAKGFIEECRANICVNCYRTWSPDEEQCLYCGEEDYTIEKGYYKYK